MTNRTYSKKKLDLRTNLKKLTEYRYLIVLDLGELRSNIIHEFRNYLRSHQIFNQKVFSNHLKAISQLPLQKGNKLMVGCAQFKQLFFVMEYLVNKNITSSKYIKANELIPITYVIDKGPTKLKAGPAYDLLESLTSVKLQKNMICIESPIVFSKDRTLTSAEEKVLKLLEIRLKTSKLQLEKIFERTKDHQYGEKPDFVTEYLLNADSTTQSLKKCVFGVAKTVRPSGPLVLPHRLKNVIRYFIQNR